MKILITGATGKVGSRLATRLARRGHHVFALVRDRMRAEHLRDVGVELVVGDLLVPESLAEAIRAVGTTPRRADDTAARRAADATVRQAVGGTAGRSVDAVVHCAAFFRGATPEQAHATNDLGTRALADAARSASVKRFIFTSTGLVYGSTGGRLAREDNTCAPTLAYPVSKLAAEQYLLALTDLDVRVLRLPFVYGDGDPHIQEAVPMMRGFAPSQRMSIAHHADVAQAVWRLLEAPSPSHRIYNVTDDEAPDIATLFASVGAAPPDGSAAESARAFDALLDGRRIRENLGFRPEYPRLADAIAAGM